jgi:hypothetical protein
LGRFASAVGIQDGALIFADPKEALRQVLGSDAEPRIAATRQALATEARKFDERFPPGDRCRQQAWWTLGANDGAPDFIDRMIAALKEPG